MVCFNGSLVGPIVPERGLRQGGPLSSYLFLICVEGLSLSINEVASNGAVHGCKISSYAPTITHLLFADDSFLFFKANKNEAHLLNSYEMMSGQAVNYQKSGTFFNANVRRDKQQEIRDILAVNNNIRDSHYLGLPSLVGKSKRRVFSF